MRQGLLLLALMLALVIADDGHAAGTPPPQTLTAHETVALLKAEDFQRLNAAFTAEQDAYRNGVITDEDLRAAFRVFYDTDPALLVHFNEWVRRYPDVYVAQLARGIYFKYLGSKRRGGEFLSGTSEQQLRGMRMQFEEAAESLSKSFALDKKPILSYLHAIDLSKNVGDDEEVRHLLDLSLRIDPHNFIVREKYMGTLQSRWGGSLEQMVTFYEDSKRAGLSKEHLRTLEALVVEETEWTALFHEHDYAKAARVRLEVKKLGRQGCLDCFVNDAVRDNRYDDALGALSAVLKEDPKDLDVLRRRYEVYSSAGKMKESIADIKAAVALGDEYSRLLLAVHYANGVPGVLTRDFDEAGKLFRQVLRESKNPDYVKDANRSLALIEQETAGWRAKP